MLAHPTDGSRKERLSHLRYDSLAAQAQPQRWSGGFTLLEIATAIVIVGILATLLFPVYQSFRGRADAMRCATNMKGLGLGAQAYMTDHGGRWPQISPPAEANAPSAPKNEAPPASETQSQLAEQWIAALGQYGIAEKTWRCPSVEKQIKQLGNPSALEKKRIDYIPTNFEPSPESATKWPKHPWFVERSALHGSGPNVLFADGSMSNLSDLRKAADKPANNPPKR